MSAPVVIAPSFPRRRDAHDGQSVYVVEAAHALARRHGGALRAIALRLGDEPGEERDGPITITRVEPGAHIPSPFALYEAAHFERVMTRLAEEAARHVPEGAPVLVHGYELGPTAARLRRRGHRVVAVLHYLLAQESEHYLAGAEDPFRRGVMPRVLGALATRWPKDRREVLVRAASVASSVCSRGLGGVLTDAIAERAGARVVAHQLRKLRLERELVRSSDVVVGVSEGFAEAIRRFYPRARVVACHAGRPQDVRPARWEPSSRLRLLAVGRPTPQKGWDVLAEALGLIEHERPTLAARTNLTIVGGTGAWTGPHSAFGEATRRAFLSLKLVSLDDAGRLPRAEVLARYDEADLLVVPSDYEPFGLVLLEAMAAGCPVLAFDADGPRDILADGRSGWCLPKGPWRSRARVLADAIIALGQLDAEAWRARRAAARARAETFSWDRTAEAHDRWLAEAPR